MAFLICLGCSLFYALETTIVDKRLSKVSPIVLTFWSALGITVIAGVVCMFKKEDLLPEEIRFEWIALLGAIIFFFAADYTHFLALNQGAGAVLLATTYLLIPAMCSLFRWESPSWSTIVAWALATTAIILLYKDDK
jgi:drug/metabolite transporter (DMT)-like permease